MSEAIARGWRENCTPAPEPLASRFAAFDEGDARALIGSLGWPADGPVTDHESWENRVYGFDQVEGGVVLKVYRAGRWSREALEEEVAFARDLVAEGVRTPLHMELPGGEHVGDHRGLLFAVFPMIRGAREAMEDQRCLDDDRLHRLGRMAALMRRAGARREAHHRTRFHPEAMVEGLVRFVVDSGLVGDAHRADWVGCWERLPAALRVADGWPLQRVHGDLAYNNILWPADGEPVVLDLDDFDVSPAPVDMLLLDMGLTRAAAPPPPELPPAEARRQAAAEVNRLLVEGYREVAPWDPAWNALRKPWRILRHLLFDAWYVSRWHDPTFRAQAADDFDPATHWPAIAARVEAELDGLAR